MIGKGVLHSMFHPLIFRRRASSAAAVLIASTLAVAGAARAVETPDIDFTVEPRAQSVEITWSHPASSVISELTVIDSIWGGTARLELGGEFNEDCDLDIRLRSVRQVQNFRNPLVKAPTLSAPFTWQGTAQPSTSGEPDICARHTILIQAIDGGELLANGTASGAPIELRQTLDGSNVETLTIPAGFVPSEDSMPLPFGSQLMFSEGTIIAGQTFQVVQESREVRMAWDYVFVGGGEQDRISSSDPGEEELLFCRPGEWVDYKFGLQLRIVTDSMLVMDTVTDTTDVVFDTTGTDIDTTYITSERDTTFYQIDQFVPASSDTLGVHTVLFRKIDGYRLYRSDITNPNGFSVLDELLFCDSADVEFLAQPTMTYVDDGGVHNGFPYNYYVTAFDTLTSQEGSSANLVRNLIPRAQATNDMEQIRVVPNPYKRRAAWEVDGEKIEFTHLPDRATIQVYTVAGDLVNEWEHRGFDGDGSSTWDTKNQDGVLVVSGVYVFYIREAETGADRVGKFIIVR